jgi:hypothetical protein
MPIDLVGKLVLKEEIEFYDDEKQSLKVNYDLIFDFIYCIN